MAEASRLVTVKNLGAPYIVNNILALSVMALVSTFFALTFSKRRKPPALGGLEVDCGNSYPKRD